MLESVAEARSVEDYVCTDQLHRSPSLNSAMTFSPRCRALEPEEHRKEVMKWVGLSDLTLEIKVSSFKALSSNAREKSTRARASQSHPVTYTTLRKVKLRSGKSSHSKDVSYLPKGSIVVINQIKGRSGRVVFQNKDGKFLKAGWVTLYTKDKLQLLKRLNPDEKRRICNFNE